MLLFAATKHLEWDEGAEQLQWFASPAEAVACMDATFGRYLPPQFLRYDAILCRGVRRR